MKLWRPKNKTSLTILEPLGEGLTSHVYKAIRRHSHLNVEQTIAVKILNSRKTVQTLKNEIEILLQIESLHCVRMLGWADLKEGPSLLLEYLDGVSLFDLCAYEALEPQKVDEIIAQLQLGLRDLHRFGIIHCDLSAKNIFITNRGVVKILDFGFSGMGNNEEVFGTLQFLSLEAWKGQNLSCASDLFSLGLLREDILRNQIHYQGTRDYWKRRAEAVLESNDLLKRDPQQRAFLPLQTQDEERERLAVLVQRVQSKKAALRTTTKVLIPKLTKASPLSRLQPISLSFLFSVIFIFCNNLQPAVMPPSHRALPSIRLTLDVRSQKWAKMRLFKKLDDQVTEVGAPVYTPYKFQKLQIGNYELHWNSMNKSGKISVQLTQSRRILIR